MLLMSKYRNHMRLGLACSRERHASPMKEINKISKQTMSAHSNLSITHYRMSRL